LQEQIQANKRKAALIVAVFALTWFVIFGAIGVLLAGLVIGLVIGVVVSAALTVGAYLASEGVVLRRAHAVPADEVKYARFHNLVEGLCIGSGLPQPALYVVDDTTPSTFTTGRNPKRAAVVVTTGMLDTMSRVELEGILAHGLSHIRNLDILPTTIATTMTPIPSWRAGFAGETEYQADAAGVQMTRYPPGLISALKKLDDGEPSADLPATPPIADRIRALEAL
jgi:heat shock protein HtpX